MSTLGSPAPVPAPSKPRAKGWLLAVAIAGIALGAIDGCSGLSAAAAPGMLRLQSTLMNGLPADAPATKAQKEMLESTAAVYDRHHFAVVVGAYGRTTVGVAMIIAAIGCLTLRRWARKLLIGAFAGGAMLAIGLGPEIVRLQREVTAESAAHFERTMRMIGAQGANEQVTHMMGSAMRATTSLATILVTAMFVLTAAISVAGAIFLLHPKIRARFG